MKVNLKSLKRLKTAAVVLGMAAAGVCYSCSGGLGADPTEMILELESGGETEPAGDLERGIDLRPEGPDETPGNDGGGQEVPGNGGGGQKAPGNGAGGQEVPGNGGDGREAPEKNGDGAGNTPASQPASTQPGVLATAQDSHEIYYVHVCGQVVNPGVYALEPGSRIYEAVERAGGFGPEAAASYLNLAWEIADGMKIEVPTASQAKEWEKTGNTGIESGPAGADRTAANPRRPGAAADSLNASPLGAERKVNLNTAGKEELMTLKGIGEAKAEDIIKYRETYGPFQKIEDIMNISRIKDAAFQKIKDSITV